MNPIPIFIMLAIGIGAWNSGARLPAERQPDPVIVYAAPTPKSPTKREIIAASKHPEMIDHIWLHETTRGMPSSDPTALHMKCRALGKTNEFGYDPYNVVCFDTFQEAVDTIDAWLTKRDNENLCMYNKGVRASYCDYLK